MAFYRKIAAHNTEYLKLHEQVPLSIELGQLMEETGELVVAASKLSRKTGTGMYTPKSMDDIIDNLLEEISDVIGMAENVIMAMDRAGVYNAEDSFAKINAYLTSKEERFVERAEEK